MQETLEKRVWSLDQEDPMEEGMVTQSSILAWRIPGQSLLGYRMGSQRVQHDWSDLARTDSMHCAVNLINGEILVKENHIVSDFIGLTVYWGIRIIKQLWGEKKKQLQYRVSRAVSRKWRMLPKPSQGESHFSASTEAPVCSLGSRTSALGQTPKERVTNGPSSLLSPWPFPWVQGSCVPGTPTGDSAHSFSQELWGQSGVMLWVMNPYSWPVVLYCHE